MGDKAATMENARSVSAWRRIGTAGLVAAVALSAAPASAQSLTDRFKSLFGASPDKPAENSAPAEAAPDQGQSYEDCPPVSVRAGASTYAVAAPGKQAVGNDVRFQATITRMARECIKNGGEITARVGIQGRIIAGPAGAPASVEVPLRVAVVHGGVGEKVIASKAYRTTVAMSEDGSVPFSFIAEDVVYPVPPGSAGDSYIFYVGFDPQVLTSEPKAKGRKKR